MARAMNITTGTASMYVRNVLTKLGVHSRLQAAAPGRLYSKGSLPWRLLAYLLKVSPEVSKVRNVIRKRLMDEPRVKAGEKVVTSAKFLIDAESNLRAALQGFGNSSPPAPEAKP